MRKVKEWSKIKNQGKSTPETFNICDLPKNLFMATTKANLQTYQRKRKYWRRPVNFIDKAIYLVQLLIQSDGEISLLLKCILAHTIEITAIYKSLRRNLL